MAGNKMASMTKKSFIMINAHKYNLQTFWV